ncbi:MAG: hypothetical protein H7319_15930 [Spirosoma sp.]|nr:hypothetical protein [Spirosoma sp.]
MDTIIEDYSPQASVTKPVNAKPAIETRTNELEKRANESEQPTTGKAKKQTKINPPRPDHTGAGGRQTKRQQVEAYLKQRFRFRFNEISGGVEYSPAARNEFAELSDYRLNSLCREIDSERGLPVTSGTLIEYLKSDFVPAYHPFREYFAALPKQSGTSCIDELASTVTVKKPELFRLALTRWMVATVANVFQDGCQNQTALVLTGEQGGFKTTWLNLLCPPALDRYRFCGKIDLQSKDTLILLATQFIINLDDQLRELNKRDGETVKTLITHGNLTVRRPYDKIASYLTRTASFCGSINGNDFLTDPTGSRRFLPFEAERIDVDHAQRLDFDKLWAEAYALYKANFQYWFTKEETNEMFENNEDFQVTTPEYELLYEYYDVVDNMEWANVKLTTTALANKLQLFSRIPLSVRKLGEALKMSKAIKKTSSREATEKGGKVWYLRERSLDERDMNSRAHSPTL